MNYRHLGDEERHQIAALKRLGYAQLAIALKLGRAPSTISRELRRNAYATDGSYKAYHACRACRGRRSRVRRGQRIAASTWKEVDALIVKQYSPQQVVGRFKLEGSMENGISHETIYRHIWKDKARGGKLHLHLRGACKQRRKRYRRNDSRGRLAGKRMIEDRPHEAEDRQQMGHWEIDTVHGSGKEGILTMVERSSGYVMIGQLSALKVLNTNRRLMRMLKAQRGWVHSITSDNGSEFHGYEQIERKTGVRFYFAHPYHSWERGTNENTNGLIRQYLPKGESMADLTQAQCHVIAEKLNNRPRKRLGYLTPNEVFTDYKIVALRG